MSESRAIFQGTLGDINVPDVLTFLDMLGKTGTLEVRHATDVRRLYWDSGEICFADSSIPAETLPGWLALNGKVSREAVEDARKAAKKEEDVVTELVKMGELDPSGLPRSLRELVLDIVYALFEWDGGEFAFSLTDEPHEEKVVLRTSCSNIIMEGSRRLDEWRRIRTVFPNDDVFLALPEGEPQASVKLSDVEEELLGHVDGKKTVADLVQATGHDHFTTLTALHALLTTGHVEVSDEAQQGPAGGNGLDGDEAEVASTIVEVFNNIFAGIHERVVEVKGDAGRDRFRSTLSKPSFQKAGVFQGVSFADDGRLPTDAVLRNVASVEDEQRIQRLKGSMDRLLAQQVLQVDTSYPREAKHAVSELISKEKERLPQEL